jgi:hypothetical protein
MAFVRAVVFALLARVALTATLLAIMYGTFISGVGQGMQKVAVILLFGTALIAPIAGTLLVARYVWKRARVARGVLAPLAGLIAAVALLWPFPGPGESWISPLDLLAPGIKHALYSAPRGCKSFYDCAPDQRCAQKGASRDYACVGPVSSSCFAQSDCATGTVCACLCAPPPKRDALEYCERECVPAAFADQLVRPDACSLSSRQGPPPPLETPGELLLAFPPLAGPPRWVRLLCAWQGERAGFLPVAAQGSGEGSGIPLTATVLPLDAPNGGFFVVEGRFRLSHAARRGFSIDDQQVRRPSPEEAKLAPVEPRPNGPTFLGPWSRPEPGQRGLSIEVIAAPVVLKAPTAPTSVVVVNDREEPVALERIAVNGAVVAKADALFTIPARSMGRWRGDLPLDSAYKRVLHVDVLTSAGPLSAERAVPELANP